jgi:hypothetical protein
MGIICPGMGERSSGVRHGRGHGEWVVSVAGIARWGRACQNRPEQPLGHGPPYRLPEGVPERPSRLDRPLRLVVRAIGEGVESDPKCSGNKVQFAS